MVGVLKKSKTVDMTEGSVIKNVLRFALPLMATGVLQLLFNAADMIVVGQYVGDDALAAIGCTGALINLILNLFIGMSTGAGVVLARVYGARNKEYAEKVLHTSMLVSAIAGLAVTAIGLPLSQELIVMMDTPVECVEMSKQYLSIYFMGSLFNLVYNFGASMMRSLGDTVRPLIFLTLGGILNVIVNLVAVLVFHAGVAGVAYATIASQAVSAICVVVALKKKRLFVSLSFRKLGINRQALVEIVRLGIPSGLQGMMFSISNVLIQSTINSFGKVVLAGNTAAANIEGFIYVILNSSSVTAMTAVSQNYGARNYPRIKRSMLCCSFVTTATCLAVGGLAILLSDTLLGFYTDTPEAKVAGFNRLSLIASTYFLCGIMEIGNNGLRGLGYSVIPMLNALIGTCAFRLIWVYFVFPMTAGAPLDVYISYPISWIITGAAALLLFFYFYKKKKREHEAERRVDHW